MKCYVCNQVLTPSNSTSEHIILNALGGRLKSKTLICKKCNSEFGDKIDSELAKQYEFFANYLNINRDRKKIKNLKLTKDGKVYYRDPSGKITLEPQVQKQKVSSTEYTFKIVVNNSKEATKHIENFKKKYTKVDISNDYKATVEYVDGLLYTSVLGYNLAFRSICKTAVNYYLHCNGDPKYINHLIPYLKEETELFVVNFCYSSNIEVLKNKDEVSHTLYLNGDPSEGILFVYVEFFNATKFLVLLNDHYTDAKINYIYSYDLLENQEIQNPEINFNLHKPEIIDICDYGLFTEDLFLSELNKIVDSKNNHDKKKLTEKIINDTLKNMKQNNIPNEEFSSELIKNDDLINLIKRSSSMKELRKL